MLLYIKVCGFAVYFLFTMAGSAAVVLVVFIAVAAVFVNFSLHKIEEGKRLNMLSFPYPLSLP